MLALSAPAFALRPFDSTDASVAEPGALELEVGPLGLVREASANTLVGPALVANWGLPNDFELVVEGTGETPLNDSGHRHSLRLVDAAVSLKHVFRPGSLQGGAGVSVAGECGVLVPSQHIEHLGAGCTGIFSRQWSELTAHLNAGVARTQDRQWSKEVGVIIEGPQVRAWRTVAEVLGEWSSGGSRARSVLLGAVWEVSGNLAWDIAGRVGRADGTALKEIRFGFTWERAAH